MSKIAPQHLTGRQLRLLLWVSRAPKYRCVQKYMPHYDDAADLLSLGLLAARRGSLTQRVLTPDGKRVLDDWLAAGGD